MKQQNTVECSLLVLGLMLAPSTAFAQGQPDDGASASANETDKNIIVVTARGREQDLQDVPVSVSVVDGEAITEFGLRDLQDVTARLPNVRITGGTNADVLTIRGLGSGQNTGFEQSVGTFVDGVYRGRSRATRAALFDLERIEVLKGPQTTFFGNNAIAGALNIVTRKPDFEFSANGSALYSPSDGEYAVEAGVTIPASDRVAIRAAVRVAGMDGYIDNVTLGTDGPDTKDLIGRFAIRADVTDSWRSDLRIDGARLRSDDAFSSEIINCPPAPEYGGPGLACGGYLAGGATDDKFDYRSAGQESYFDYDYFELGWTNSFELGGVTLTSITSYFEHDNAAKIQLIPTPQVGIGGDGLLPTRNEEQFEQFSQEIRLTSTSGGELEWMAGAYYAKTDLDLVNRTGFFLLPFALAVPPLAPYLAPNDPVVGSPTLDEETNTYSAFGSITWNPIEPLRINAALRYTSVEKRGSRTMTFGVGDGTLTFVNPLPDVAQQILAAGRGANLAQYPITKRTDDKWMPSIGLQYDLTPEIMAYASYTIGFKSGGFDASAQGGVFGPESVDAYEAGIKGTAFDRALTFSLVGFRGDYSDLQETTIVFVGSGANQTIVSRVANAAKSRVQGIELSAAIKVSPKFQLRGELGYLDSTYRDFPNGACTVLGALLTPNCVQDLSGKNRPFAPRWSGTFGANLTLPVGNLDLRIDPQMYFSSRYFLSAAADSLLEQNGYAKFDLRVGIGPSDKAWEFAVIGKNLSDQATSSFQAPLATSNGAVVLYPERPRSVAFQLRFKY
ncbi:MAG: TonB-dependent receptor [Parasphingorhabdus sp.]|uniref:TonB-dependent receptor n=1 Tax=Parasphingorhabdus sp. TaxID=2709688 RepID=UPI003001FABE